MAPAAFAEVLAASMDRYESREPSAAGRWHPGIATRALFEFEGVPSSPLRPLATPAFAFPHPARTLTRSERDALAAFDRLGASLRADFTSAELRSSFRALARLYHPDRHPGSSAAERTRLSASFAALRSAYVVLKACASRPRMDA
jgi:hypothetical protein